MADALSFVTKRSKACADRSLIKVMYKCYELKFFAGPLTISMKVSGRKEFKTPNLTSYMNIELRL